jgi:integrase
MLHVYRRHLSACSRKKRQANCSCPIWVQGRLHGEMMRKSLGIRNWGSAQKIVRVWEAGNRVEVVSVRDAFERYLADCEARHLRPETLRKYRLLEREMIALFGSRAVHEVGIDDLAKYRESWGLAPVTSWHKIERLRSFFKFCIERGFIEKNPALLMRHPKTVSKPSVPFTEEELEKIMGAIEEFPDSPPGRRKQLRAFVLLLRYSGLRIQDAIRLTMDKILDGKLMARPYFVPPSSAAFSSPEMPSGFSL